MRKKKVLFESIIFDQSFFISFKHSFFIKLFNLTLVVFLCFVALNLHSVSQDSSNHKWLGFEEQILWLFKALESSFFSNVVQIYNKITPNCWILTKLLISTVETSLLCEFMNCLFMWDQYGNSKALSRFSMNENLCNLISFEVDILHFLSCDVLSLLKLENIFLSINNTQSFSGCTECSNITSLQPSIFS